MTLLVLFASWKIKYVRTELLLSTDQLSIDSIVQHNTTFSQPSLRLVTTHDIKKMMWAEQERGLGHYKRLRLSG